MIDESAVITSTVNPPPGELGVTPWSSRLLAGRLTRDGTPISFAEVAPIWRDRATATSSRDVQVLHRSAAGSQDPRPRRVVSRPTGQRGRGLLGREVADPAVGPDRAAVADAHRRGRTPHARLQRARHHHPGRRPGGRGAEGQSNGQAQNGRWSAAQAASVSTPSTGGAVTVRAPGTPPMTTVRYDTLLSRVVSSSLCSGSAVIWIR